MLLFVLLQINMCLVILVNRLGNFRLPLTDSFFRHTMVHFGIVVRRSYIKLQADKLRETVFISDDVRVSGKIAEG